MKKKVIAIISGAMLLTIAAGSIYGKSVSSHTEREPDVVGTFSMNRDEKLTVVANREQIEDKVAFARELLQMYKDNSFYSTKFSTDRGYATSLVEQMKQAQGITEQLKADNTWEWVGRMNNIQACAREIVEKEIIYE